MNQWRPVSPRGWCVIQKMRGPRKAVGLYAYMATNNDNVPDMRSQMAAVEAPALVIQGQCDYIGFPSAYEYMDVFPNARYEFVEGCRSCHVVGAKRSLYQHDP